MAGSRRKGPHFMFPATAQSTLSCLAWPGLATQHGARLLALLYQMEQSQWWSPGQLRRHQFRQLAPLIQYAFNNVPYYRNHR